MCIRDRQYVNRHEKGRRCEDDQPEQDRFSRGRAKDVYKRQHLDIATKEMLITALAQYEGTMLFVSHDRHFLAALSNRVLEMTPEGIHQYDGGYTEYVARTGHEAPGLHA